MIEDFEPQQALLRVCFPDSFQPKPRVTNLILEARILFQFVSQNMIPRAGHRDAPTFSDICFVDSILVGRELNLPFFILHEMINAIENRRSSLPYGFLLTRVFQHFNIPTIDEVERKLWTIDVEMNNKTFSLIGFNFINNKWVGKTKQVHEQGMGALNETDNMKVFSRALMLRRLLHNFLTILKPSIACQNVLIPSNLTFNICMTLSLSTSRFYQPTLTQSANIKNVNSRSFKTNRI
ncbi:hypothetical protein PanWU01x14_188670 [Parasponia andersonii]|uniref:Putative plant transposon protein domain-containing protein n=1 Tax=Parasponia andersonii TaxID=3476 RepID=A0A2P5C2R9_PARAD|nr:hypothetical protein PanWU01x14_188670 [Parasponia andersonii]